MTNGSDCYSVSKFHGESFEIFMDFLEWNEVYIKYTYS